MKSPSNPTPNVTHWNTCFWNWYFSESKFGLEWSAQSIVMNINCWWYGNFRRKLCTKIQWSTWLQKFKMVIPDAKQQLLVSSGILGFCNGLHCRFAMYLRPICNIFCIQCTGDCFWIIAYYICNFAVPSIFWIMQMWESHLGTIFYTKLAIFSGKPWKASCVSQFKRTRNHLFGARVVHIRLFWRLDLSMKTVENCASCKINFECFIALHLCNLIYLDR